MTTREVGNRTVWCATCAGGAWSYADVIREAGLALGDGDLEWKDGLAFHRGCGGRVVSGGSWKVQFRSTCMGCGAPLEGQQVRWCGTRAPAPWHGQALCFIAWHHPRRLWRLLLERQEGICHICDKEITEQVQIRKRWDGTEYEWKSLDFEVDHIEPLAKGGARTLDNLAVAHRLCNQLKKDKPLELVRAQIANRARLFEVTGSDG